MIRDAEISVPDLALLPVVAEKTAEQSAKRRIVDFCKITVEVMENICYNTFVNIFALHIIRFRT